MLGLTIAIERGHEVLQRAGTDAAPDPSADGPIMIAGTEKQKQRYLPGIARERRARVLSLRAGRRSDVAGMQSRAIPDPDVPAASS